jgi:translocation and assembly module TamA
MDNVGNPHRLLPACLLGFALAITTLTSGAAETQQSPDAGNMPAITLSAPDSVRELLKAHFELPGTPLSDEAVRATFLRRAQREIGDLLATEGYFTPTIALHPAGSNGDQVVEVTPGPVTHVAQVNIEFKGDLAEDTPAHRARIEQLRAAWTLGVGKSFRSSEWQDAKAALLSGVAQEDYAGAQIALSQAEVNRTTASVQLMVVVDSGPAFRFGDLAVNGLERYDRDLVTRLAPFHAGDPYRRDQLLTFQARLQSMPQFSSVIVNIETDEATHDTAPIKVDLVEAKSRRVAVGLGYSSNNGARTEINYLSHNFLERAWNQSTRLRLEQNQQTLSAGIDTLPDDNGYRLSWGASSQITLIQGLKTIDRNLGVTRSRTLGQIETQTGINWQEEDKRPEGGTREINQALVLDWQWRRRAVDDPLYPRRGSLAEIHVGGASRELLSDQNFLRSYARQQIWWPVGEHDTFSLRGEAGYTAAPSRIGIPQEYLFRAGGSQSVRGYAYQSLGVHEGTAVVGGRILLTGSAEYTHWFTHDWGAALFADTGDATDVWRDLHLAAGYGSGARWRSPVGPLALDLAWGRETHAWRLHFSIAVAF